MEYYSSYYLLILKGTCTSLEQNGPIYDIFSSVRLIGQTNVPYIKSLITKMQLQTFFSTTSRQKKERFLHGRFWSRARQRDVLTDRISSEQLRDYFEQLAVNG